MTATVAATRRVPAAAIAAALALLWLIVAPRTPDLAAAVYRAGLVAREGSQLYDSAWFGGHHLPGYSIVAPILGAEVGVRFTGAGCARRRSGRRGEIVSRRAGVANCARAPLHALHDGRRNRRVDRSAGVS